jgi:hypothetical protein
MFLINFHIFLINFHMFLINFHIFLINLINQWLNQIINRLFDE